MVNRKLVALIAAGTLLSLGHMADHVIRENLRWPSREFLVLVIASLVLYGAIGVSLYLYVTGKLGPRFWTFFAFAGVLFGWAGHFSPFTEQPPSFILRAYGYDLAGWLAVAVLSALMLVTAVAGVYAAYLWGSVSGRRIDQHTADKVLRGEYCLTRIALPGSPLPGEEHLCQTADEEPE